MSSRKLLTIGVPTFNRAFILRDFLKCLQSDLNSFEHKVKVIISDNCSTDNTSEVVEDWIRNSRKGMEVEYIKNESNFGVSRNIVSLYYKANSQYFMFLGDDDRINVKEFSKIISILESRCPPSAIIQSAWDSNNNLPKNKYLEFEEVVSMFYEFGNAWASIVDTAAALEAIDSRRIRNDIEKIVWPQTVIGYLLMFDLKNIRKPYAFDGQIGFPISTERHSIDTGDYWIKSLNDLLVAASIVDYWVGTDMVKKSFLSFRSIGYINHVKAIFINSLIEPKPLNIKSLKDTLINHYGFCGLIWGFVFEILKFKKIQIFIIKIYFFIFKRYSFAKIDDRFNRLKEKRVFDISKAKKNNKRNGDWF